GLRQAVEAVVELHRVEGVGVVLEPLVDRQFARIEAAPPVPILPAGAANADLLRTHAIPVRTCQARSRTDRDTRAVTAPAYNRRREARISCRRTATATAAAAAAVCRLPWPLVAVAASCLPECSGPARGCVPGSRAYAPPARCTRRSAGTAAPAAAPRSAR